MSLFGNVKDPHTNARLWKGERSCVFARGAERLGGDPVLLLPTTWGELKEFWLTSFRAGARRRR